MTRFGLTAAIAVGGCMLVFTPARPVAAQATAADPWALCGAPLVPPMPETPARPPEGAVTVEAGSARYDRDHGEYTFLGDPVLRRGDRRITAERMDYREATGTVRAEGGLRYREPGVAVEGERGDFQVQRNSGRVDGVRYRFSAGHLHGSAARLTLIDRERSRYEDVSLTTCAPGDETWWLRAGEVRIDRGTRQGVARDAWLSLGGVPLLYAPWLRFPVGSDRLTGFLAPTVGYSGDGGAEVGVPFYWNIAPHYDATFTPTAYSKRGLLLGSELRYLQPAVEGEIRGAFLPDDSAHGDDRWAIDQEHRLAVGAHLRGELRQQRVSDPSYPNDFDTDLDTERERYLESRASLAWSEADWSATADAQDWQTVDRNVAPTNRPYARQPRLRLRYEPYAGRWLAYGLEAEATRFAHDAADRVDTGDRLDVTGRLALPLETLGYFVRPEVAWRYTGYDLDRPAPDSPETPDRSLPVYSIDAGLFLERRTSLFERALTQTLEPRLFFVQVPERDQDALPRFDTQRAELTFGQLFRANRFTGADRVGDTRQLSVGLTSRLLDSATGQEYLSVSAGQIVYFDDREVTLSGEPETDNRSDYVGRLSLALGAGLSASLDGRIDPDDSGNREWHGTLQYRDDAGGVLNLGYRDRRLTGQPRQEVGRLSLAWPVARQWTLFGGWRYDVTASETEDGFAGLEYESCCYAVRAVHRTSLEPQESGPATTEQSFMLELELKGLGGVGDRLSDFLTDRVPGYRARR